MTPAISIVSSQPVRPADFTGLPDAASSAVAPRTFSQLVTDAVDSVELRAQAADAAVRSFALGDSMPVHHVSYALQQARLSLELAIQVRNRMLEGYQQLMNMQL